MEFRSGEKAISQKLYDDCKSMLLKNFGILQCGVDIMMGNEKSKRVQEKCGFVYHHTEKDKPCPLMGDVRTEHFTYLTKEQWLANE